MVRFSNCLRLVVIAAASLSLHACAADTTDSTPTDALVIHGAGSPAEASFRAQGDSGLTFGPASSLTMKLYALYISAHGDCSSPVLVEDLGASGADKDFMTNPVLFSGSPDDGSYECVMFKMSDVLKMKPGTTFGGCVAGTEYVGDIYREGENDWRDVDLNSITGTGSDDLPIDSHVTIFMSRDTTAALARGISRHQLIPLQSSLLVPGQSTFHMDASHAVGTEGVHCGIMPPVMSFQGS